MATENLISIDKIIAEFANVGAAQTATKGKLDQQEGALNESVAREAENLKREAELSGQISGLVDEILIRRSDRNKTAAAEFGTNPDASNYVIGELAKTSIDNTRKLTASAQNLQEQFAIGPGDNLLQWLTNQFTLPNEVAAHNTLAVEQQVITSAISRLQAQTQEQVKINNAIDANTSKEIISANSSRLLAAATIKAENARQEALKVNMHVGSVRLATDQQQFTNTLALVRAQVDLQQLQIQKQRNQLDEDLKQERLEAMRRKEKSDLDLQVDLNRATHLLGMRNVTPEQFRAMQGPRKNALEFAMSDPSLLEGRLGPNPAIAIEIAAAVNAPLTPATTYVKDKLIDIMVTAQSRPDWAALKPEQKQAEHNKAIKEVLEKELRNISDSGSIFSAPPLASIGKIPRVEGTALWKNYLAPLAANQQMPTSANQMFQTALKAVQEDKLSIEQASFELAEIYTAINADNWHNRDYGRFAISVPEKYRFSYYARIQGPYYFGSEQPVNLTNATAVRNQMLRHLNALRPPEETSPAFLP